jgi:hypothetical protein
VKAKRSSQVGRGLPGEGWYQLVPKILPGNADEILWSNSIRQVIRKLFRSLSRRAGKRREVRSNDARRPENSYKCVAASKIKNAFREADERLKADQKTDNQRRS